MGLRDRRIALQASGDANLGILQGFSRDVFGSGRAELTASVDGPLDAPVFSGSASMINGRVRHLSMPNALDGINGIIRFDARGIRLDEVTARMGEGPVQFGGRIGFDGFLPGELNVTCAAATCTCVIPRASGPLLTPTCPSAATSGRPRSAGW